MTEGEKQMSSEELSALYSNSLLLKKLLEQRHDIDIHKWCESEKVGHDIGIDAAIVSWVLRYKRKFHLSGENGN